MANSDSSHFLDDSFLYDAPPPPEKSSPPPPPTKAPPPPPDSSPPPPDEISPPPPAATRTPPSQSTSPPPPEKGFNNNPPPKNSNNNSPALNDRLLPPPPPPSLRNNTLADEHVTNSSSSGNNHHLPVIVGFSIAGGLLLVLLIVCCVCCKRKKKQRPYYYDQERPPNGPFYNGTAQWNKNPHSMEMGMKIPPPPYGSGQWGATPSPRGNYSGENSSSGYYPSGQNPPLSIPPHSSSNMSGLGFSSQSQFSYEDLAKATNGFSQANLLGQGGFGYVYKGVLPDGKIVAVKSLKSGSGQGEREFQAEVEIISRVHHRHLVSLVGYCIADGQRMLVYEFVSNSTMEHHLHGKGQPVMDWSSRMRIAIGSAKGLAYLHEDCHPRIIHRDIKAANILLDDNYEAMVADFGLAKLTTDNATHVSTRVMGTFGYLAPEYASSGKLTEKSDVFSFGVMLLELITGHRPVDLTGQIMEDSLVDWARPYLAQALEDGNYSELADPKMEGNYAPNEMASMISCAAASIRHSGRRRAKMSQIVRALEGGSILSEETTEIKKTTRNNNASGSNNHDNNTYDTVAYNADIKKFRNMVIMDDETN